MIRCSLLMRCHDEDTSVVCRTFYSHSTYYIPVISMLLLLSTLPYSTLTLLYCTRQECPHVRGAVPARVVGGLPHISTQHRHRCGRHRRLHCPRAGSGAGWGGSNSRSQHGEGTAASRSKSQRDDFSQKDRAEDSMFEAGRDDGR